MCGLRRGKRRVGMGRENPFEDHVQAPQMRRYAKLVASPQWVHVAAPRPTSEAQNLVIVYVIVTSSGILYYTTLYYGNRILLIALVIIYYTINVG